MNVYVFKMSSGVQRSGDARGNCLIICSLSIFI